MTTPLTPFHGGVHPPNTNNSPAKRRSAAAGLPLLRLSLAQSVGTPRPCAGVGQRVLKGQRLADADGAIVAVHATSGVVRAIGSLPLAHPWAERPRHRAGAGRRRALMDSPLDWRHADPAQSAGHPASAPQ